VVARRRGREKLHFLNPVPIRLVHDRWVSKYAEPWAVELSGLKQRLESPVEKVFEIYIRTTPERLWEAITDSEIRGKFQFGLRVRSDWTQGSRFELSHPNADVVLGEGENLEIDPPRRLVQSMVALWGEDVRNEGTSRVTWEIEPIGDSCRLTVTHDQLREGANEELYGGWPMILSGLKTWLETAQVLTTPGSLMYS
ncbi:MAG: SRPBCC family protein, partial [Nocardioidaceae bacterium]|nr:SRPBCC family protein [Nocardioidaceae bacterium]